MSSDSSDRETILRGATESADDDALSAEGLRRFYASQAEAMLAQYTNINHLLGPTTHHTHPGTHCELLLRDCLGQVLPPSLSADKGFFFGRATRNGESQHSPEIDILIHDTAHFTPIFRLHDFVIVHAAAVVGLIQVKKSFGGSQCESGIRNVVVGKQHLFDLCRKMNGGKYRPDNHLPFSAVVGFEGNTSESMVRSCLTACVEEHQAYDCPADAPWTTSMLILPDFIGTLTGQMVVGSSQSVLRRDYYVMDSHHDGLNVAIQMLIWSLAANRPEFYAIRRTFDFHNGQQPTSRFTVPAGGQEESRQDSTTAQ